MADKYTYPDFASQSTFQQSQDNAEIFSRVNPVFHYHREGIVWFSDDMSGDAASRYTLDGSSGIGAAITNTPFSHVGNNALLLTPGSTSSTRVFATARIPIPNYLVNVMSISFTIARPLGSTVPGDYVGFVIENRVIHNNRAFSILLKIDYSTGTISIKDNNTALSQVITNIKDYANGATWKNIKLTIEGMRAKLPYPPIVAKKLEVDGIPVNLNNWPIVGVSIPTIPPPETYLRLRMINQDNTSIPTGGQIIFDNIVVTVQE